MIINWHCLYPNGSYYSGGLYGENGIIGYTAPTVLPTDADGVYFSIQLGGGLIYLKRVG